MVYSPKDSALLYLTSDRLRTSHSSLSLFLGVAHLSTHSCCSSLACWGGCSLPRLLVVILGPLDTFRGSLSSKEGSLHCELPTYDHIGKRSVVSARFCFEGHSCVQWISLQYFVMFLLRKWYQCMGFLVHLHHHTRSYSGFHVLCNQRLHLGPTLDIDLGRILFP